MRGGRKRRIRVRRKRRADDVGPSSDDVEDAGEIIGCCLIEVALASATLVALIAVPVGLLLG